MDLYLISHIQSFLRKEYIYVAVTSKAWNKAWKLDKDTETSIVEAVRSPSRVHIVLEALRSRDSLNNRAYFHSCKFGNLQVLEVMFANKRPTDEYVCAGGAVASGDVKVLSWIVDKGFRYDRFVCHRSAEAGNVDMLNWALAKGFPFDSQLLEKYN